MTDTKHTPGPWTYTHSGLSCFSLDAGKENIVSGCGCCGSPEISSEANARLIAAAPELLDALEGVLYRIKASEHWWMDEPTRGGFDAYPIVTAIAKAKGEPR